MLATAEATTAPTAGEWESFSFEPVPPLVTMCDMVAEYLNTGKSVGQAYKAMHWDFDKTLVYEKHSDGGYNVFSDIFPKLKPMMDPFLEALEARGIHEQISRTVVDERLDAAGCRPLPKIGSPRVVQVPAGLGSMDLWTEVRWSVANFFNGGSNMKNFEALGGYRPSGLT